MIESSLSLQRQNGILVGTGGLCLGENHIRLTCIVFDNLVLDIITLADDEVEDFVGTGSWKCCLLGTCGVVNLERYTAVLANQGVIEVSTCPASLILIIVVEEHLLLIIEIELELVEFKIRPVVYHLIAVGDALISRRPDGLVSIDRTPVAIEEVLYRIAIVAIFRLISCRGKHSSRKVTPVGIDICVYRGHQSTYVFERALDVFLVVGCIFIVVHITRRQRHGSQHKAK